MISAKHRILCQLPFESFSPSQPDRQYKQAKMDSPAGSLARASSISEALRAPKMLPRARGPEPPGRYMAGVYRCTRQ